MDFYPEFLMLLIPFYKLFLILKSELDFTAQIPLNTNHFYECFISHGFWALKPFSDLQIKMCMRIEIATQKHLDEPP